MQFKEALSVDEAEVLAGRFSLVNGRHYVLNHPENTSASSTLNASLNCITL